MLVTFLKPAQTELDDAYLYYEDLSKGLGESFLIEIIQTIKRIQKNPTSWAPFSENTRRCLTHKFPYGIIYQLRNNKIVIVAIAHLHRKPGYWNSRIE
jgi:plasmid stabilization system protein ParE